MSANRVCCNCRHNIRSKGKSGITECHCEIDGHYIGYVECMETGWCHHWATDEAHWKAKEAEKRQKK